MSRGVQRTAVGVGFALALAVSTLPAVQAAPAVPHGAREARVFRPTGQSLPAAQEPSLLDRFRSLFASIVAGNGGDPHGPQLTQGPTVDPNGLH